MANSQILRAKTVLKITRWHKQQILRPGTITLA